MVLRIEIRLRRNLPELDVYSRLYQNEVNQFQLQLFQEWSTVVTQIQYLLPKIYGIRQSCIY